jgi:hypothetical protein
MGMVAASGSFPLPSPRTPFAKTPIFCFLILFYLIDFQRFTTFFVRVHYTAVALFVLVAILEIKKTVLR